MSLQRTRLAEVEYIASSVAAFYTNPSSTKTFVKGILIHNTNTTTETVLIHWVPASDSPDSSNRIFKLTVASNETVILEIPFSLVMLDSGETLQAVTTTASKVTIVAMGDIDS